MTVNYLPLESEYGFKSTGFTVDILGNLTARTITATEAGDGGGGGGPTISIGNFSFTGSNIDTVDSSSIAFIPNVVFDSDVNVQNDLRVTNKIVAAGPITASAFLSNGVGTPTISSVTSIELDAASAVIIKSSPLRLASLTTSQRNSLTAQPGDVIYNSTTTDLNFYNGTWRSLTGNITFNGSTISAGTSQNVTIYPQTGGAVIITSPATGTLNNITIGNATPAAATFTTATANSMILNNLPTTTTSATRKDYVDNRITAFAIAFGA
jgi:hypothetical protein